MVVNDLYDYAVAFRKMHFWQCYDVILYLQMRVKNSLFLSIFIEMKYKGSPGGCPLPTWRAASVEECQPGHFRSEVGTELEAQAVEPPEVKADGVMDCGSGTGTSKEFRWVQNYQLRGKPLDLKSKEIC